MDIRVGYGYDIHQLVNDRKLILAGVEIPSDFGEKAHSDGDVLYHSLANALYSSVGLEDIGVYFPDNLTTTENMDSSLIVKDALNKVKEKGYLLSNVTIDIVLEKPKLLPYRELIKQNVASLLGLSLDRVALMANTGEKIGIIGTSQAIEVYTTLLVIKG